MAVTKLTLSADKDVVRRAKRWAAANNTSLSSTVGKFLKSLADADKHSAHEPLTPRVRRVLGMAKVPAKPYKELLVEALLDKYDLREKK